jgi:hypothetical protein
MSRLVFIYPPQEGREPPLSVIAQTFLQRLRSDWQQIHALPSERSTSAACGTGCGAGETD